jgi:hypothetical protein
MEHGIFKVTMPCNKDVPVFGTNFLEQIFWNKFFGTNFLEQIFWNKFRVSEVQRITYKKLR